MNVLVLIPARAGSKGLPGKNLRRVAGISLVGHAVRVGRSFLRASGHAGSVLIDTDSESIAAEAIHWGAEAPFLRPSALAADDTKTIDSVLHALDRLEAAGRHHDLLVLLQPTSPLRATQDVSACLAAYDPALGSSVSVVQIEHPSEQSLTLAADGTIAWSWPELNPDRRRQEFPAAWRPSGSVYVSSVESLRTHRAFVIPGRTRGVAMPAARSIDIDRAEDLALAEALVRSSPIPGLRIGNREIGAGCPCFVMANAVWSGDRAIGETSVQWARRAIDRAAAAGADAISLTIADPGPTPEHAAAAGAVSFTVSDPSAILDRTAAAGAVSFTVSDPSATFDRAADSVAELLGHARTRRIELLFCPADEAHADALDAAGVSAFRVDRALWKQPPLLRLLASKGKPLLLDGDGADVVELDEAMAAIPTAPRAQVALVDPRLSSRLDLQTALRVPVGFADRQPGIGPAVAAASLGAAIVDKAVDLDGAFPDELGDLVRAIRAAEAELTPAASRLSERAPT